MLFFKFLKTILFGTAKLLAFCVKIIYNILKLLKIRVLTLYLIVCGFVQLIFHAFDGNAVWFFLGLAVCGVVTVGAWIFAFTRGKRVKERKRKEREKDGEEDGSRVPPPPEKPEAAPEPAREYPQYYWVKEHENYYFAEYGDRYELFRRTERGDEYIRTDYK